MMSWFSKLYSGKETIKTQFEIFLCLFSVTAIVLLDRLSKIYFLNLLDVGESIPLIRNVVHFTLVFNTGIAFGLFKNQGIIFVIIAVIAIVLLIYNIYYYFQHEKVLSRTYIVAVSLILGGAIGNLIDRIYYGQVIDFIDLRIWPVFNIADSAITIGAILFVVKCIPLSSKSDL